MRCRFLLPIFLAAACTGSISGDDDGDDGDDSAAPDGGSFDEPPGLVGTTEAHNVVRAAHGVAPLTWDPALAVIAQGWAEQCVDSDAPIGLIDHNAGRSDTYPTYVGENIYGSSGGASGTDAVQLWVTEEQYYDYPSNTCAGGQICGHYTQVVWAATTKVGCGIHTCPGLQFGSSVVCDYGPGGNDGGPPY
jgi:pathogenesis-related protein 1